MNGTRYSGLLIFTMLVGLLSAQREHNAFATGSGGPIIPEQAAYDVTFYDLALSVSPSDSSIAGTVTMTATVIEKTEQIVIDLDYRYTVSEIVDGNGSAYDWERRDGELWITTRNDQTVGTELKVAITYAGRPKIAPNPPWVGGFVWSYTDDGQPWVATACQMDGADLWWPCKDHPSDKPDSVALHITVPGELIVAANGRDRGVEDLDDGRKRYNWFVSTPIANYAVALNIAPYVTISSPYISVTGEEVPMTFWVLPQDMEKAKVLYPKMQDHLRFFEEMLGPYPFRADKYGVAHTPHKGMEHQTIIAYGDPFTDNAYGFDGLHFHELAHEWFANLSTAPDWNDIWMHEGFAIYMEALYAERLGGTEALHAYMKGKDKATLNILAVAPRQSMDILDIYFRPDMPGVSNGDIYGKGGVVLHALRYLIGDEAFFKAIRRTTYPDPAMESVTDGSQVHFTTTEDFRAVAEAAYGADLSWFFEVYIRQPHLPELVERRDGSRLTLQWITPGDLPFPMPVDVAINGKIKRVEVSTTKVKVRVGRRSDVVVDPRTWVLKKTI